MTSHRACMTHREKGLVTRPRNVGMVVVIALGPSAHAGGDFRDLRPAAYLDAQSAKQPCRSARQMLRQGGQDPRTRLDHSDPNQLFKVDVVEVLRGYLAHRSVKLGGDRGEYEKGISAMEALLKNK